LITRGAELEPEKQYGKPFRKDPAATETQFQTELPDIVATHPTGIRLYHFKGRITPIIYFPSKRLAEEEIEKSI